MIFGGLIVIALFAALIAPWFIDWTAYRTAFEREATKVVGQPVHVAGTASVRILPLPSVTFTDLTVGENPDGSPMMTVDSFSLNAELMPILSGELRIIDMVLERPAISVVVDEGGTVAWTARKELLVNPEKVNVENLKIENGSFRIEGLAGGRTIEGNAISASIRARSLLGPWQIAADGVVDGFEAALEISTGRLQDEGAIRVRAVSRRAGVPYRLILDGPLAVKQGVLSWDGQFEVTPAREPAVPGEGLLEDPLPVLAAGRFAATPERVEVPEYRLEIGSRDDPYTITGTARANIREEIFFRASADGRQIDLDRLGKVEGVEGQPAASLDSRVAALRNVVDQMPVPNARGEIDIVLPAIVAGDTVIRDVKATVEPDGNGWRVATFNAALPGNTLVEARGRLGTGRDFGFSGHMLMASRQPTGFAAWLAGKSNAALRRLNTAGFSADVTLSGRQATFENLELILNEAILKGKLQRLAPTGGRAAIVAELSGDRVNTDDLVAIYSLTEKDDGPALTNHDLDVDVKAGVLEGMGLVARDVDAHIRVEAGSVSIDRLNAGDFYGAEITSSGRLADLTDKPSGRFALSIEAGDGARLADFALRQLGENRLLAEFAADPDLSRDLSAKIEIEARPRGEVSKGTLTASGWAGGTAFALRDRFEGQPVRWREAVHDISAKFQQAEPGMLARQFALPVTPVAADGPVTVTAELSGNPRQGMRADISASAPGTDLSASGRLAFARPGSSTAGDWQVGVPEFDLEVTFGSSDIDPWLIMAGYPLPGTGEGHPASATFSAAGKDGALSLTKLSGTHGDNGFAGEITIAAGAGERPKATGNLSFDSVSVPFAAEMMLGAGTVSADPLTGTVADSEFGVPLLAGVDAELLVKAASIDFGGGPAGRELSAEAVLVDGALSLPRFSARWLGGAVSGNLSLKNAERNAIVNAQLTLAGVDVGALIGLAGFAPVIAGDADVGITVDSAGRSLRGLVSALSGSGVVSLGDSEISGISTAGLDHILAAADDEAFEVNAANITPIVRETVLTGQFPAAAYSGAFTLAQGRLSVRNVRLASETGTLEGGGSYEPLTGRTEIDVTAKLDAGDEALAGADPAVDLVWAGMPGSLNLALGTRALEGYLSLRAFEREQRKVEILQESVLEKQRLRRETVLSHARMASRERQRLEELRRLEELQRRMEEERRIREDAERRKAEEAAGAGPSPAAGSAKDAAVEGEQIPDDPEPRDPAAITGAATPDAAEAAVPEPAPRQGNSAQALPDKKGIVSRTLPPPQKPAPTSLFEDIRRKLFGQ